MSNPNCRQDQVAQEKPPSPPAHQSFESSRYHHRHRGDLGDYDRDRNRDRDRERERERDRHREIKRRSPLREEEQKERDKARDVKLLEREKAQEPEAVKVPSEKFRVSFDWENMEDTSGYMNSLHQNTPNVRWLFGREFRAEMVSRVREKEIRDEMRKKIRTEDFASWRLNDEEVEMYNKRVDRHWSAKLLKDMTERDWMVFREDFNIFYKGSRIPRPMRSWADSKLSPELLKAVDRAGYYAPSPIQMAAIPLGLQQRDVIGVADTGSGKTAAFVLPMLTYITRLPPISEENVADGPYAVVMAPTTVVAQQIEDETVKFAHYLGIKVVSIVGGQSIEEQGFKIRQGCEVMIATPGRLIDCLQRGYAVLNQCNYVVLDEADQMIDMGFEPQVVGVLDAIPSSNFKPENEELDEKKIYRTTHMFTATMPLTPAVQGLARKYLRNPVVVSIGTAGEATTDLITQHVIMVKESEKMSMLQKLLDDLGDKTAIVFLNTRKAAYSVLEGLDKIEYQVTTLHGYMSQEQIEISLEGFRNKKYNVLVATDVVVAGRGIDIPDVAHVINYDMPKKIGLYIRRIGRAGKTGIATTFLTLDDTVVFYDLEKILIQSNCCVPPELSRHKASRFKAGSIPGRPPKTQ